jgi:hypothetical protein
LPETVSAVDEAYVAFQLVDQPVVMVPRVEVELLKLLSPVQVLLLASKVEEAAVMVPVPPRAIEVLLIVIDAFCSWLLPIVVVETKRVPSYASRVPWVKEVALVPPLVIASAPVKVSVPKVAVFDLRSVEVAPDEKVASDPWLEAPVTLKVAAWSPPTKVEVAGEPKVAAPVDPLNVRAAVVEVARAEEVDI